MRMDRFTEKAQEALVGPRLRDVRVAACKTG